MSFKKIDFAESALLDQFMRMPYLHRGRSLAGSDCYGCIVLWYRLRLGLELWDIEEDYDQGWKWEGREIFLENYYKEWIRVDEPGKYDVILFKTRDHVDHAGIYLRDNKFLHTCRAGTVISKITDPIWRDKVEGFYRLKRRHES